MRALLRRLWVCAAALLLASGCTTMARPVAPPVAGPASAAVAPSGAEAAVSLQGRRVARLVAVSGEAREVPLRWQPVFRGEVRGYRIHRRDVEAAGAPVPPFVEIGRVMGLATTTFVDRGGAPAGRPGRLEDGRAYVYAVAAFGDGWTGEWGEPAGATTAPPPAAPDGLDPLPPRAGEVLLVWEPPADRRVGGYRIFRSAFPAGPFEPVGETTDRLAAAFADPAQAGLARLRSYYYRVAAVSVAGAVGPPSETVTARLKPPPLPPLDLVAVGGLARHVRLRWSAGPESDLRTVAVWRAMDDGPFRRVATVPATRSEYTDGGLGDGVTARYRLAVLDADGLESEPSAPAVATTRPRPPAPREVTVVREGDGVLVRWRAAPPAAGVSRYRVVRIGRFGGTETLVEVTGTVARDAVAAPRYAVVAVDVEGLESLPSEPVAPGPAR